MPLRLSTGLVDDLCDTGSIKSVFNNAGGGGDAGFLIDIYTGSQPAAADDASTGTKLVTVSVGGDGTGATFEASATDGVLEKTAAETLSGTAVATGTAGWFRLRRKADTGTASSATEQRIDGTCGTSGQQMNLGSLTITSGAPFVLSTLSVTLPKA